MYVNIYIYMCVYIYVYIYDGPGGLSRSRCPARTTTPRTTPPAASLGVMVYGLWFRVEGCRFEIWGFGFRV